MRQDNPYAQHAGRGRPGRTRSGSGGSRRRSRSRGDEEEEEETSPWVGLGRGAAALIAAFVLWFVAPAVVRDSGWGWVFVGGEGVPQLRYDEIVLRRDQRVMGMSGVQARGFGFSYTHSLVVSGVEPGSPAHDAGMYRFQGRRIRRVNGVAVHTGGDFEIAVEARRQRTSLSQHITIELVAPFLVGGQIRTLRRIAFRSGQYVEPGAIGVVMRVPGEAAGSPAQVRIQGYRFNVMPGQVEPVVEEDVLPHRIERRPGWIVKGRAGERDVARLLTGLGHPEHLRRMMDAGFDRIDHVAAGTITDAASAGIPAEQFARMKEEAQKVVRVRQATDEQRLGEELAEVELGRLAAEEDAARRRAEYEAEEWQRSHGGRV